MPQFFVTVLYKFVYTHHACVRYQIIESFLSLRLHFFVHISHGSEIWCVFIELIGIERSKLFPNTMKIRGTILGLFPEYLD